MQTVLCHCSSGIEVQLDPVSWSYEYDSGIADVVLCFW